MNHYEEKKQARIDRYREKSGEARVESEKLHGEFDKRMSAIPLGQPLLVDHYSYKSDLNYRNKAHKKLEQSWTANEKAAYYADKATAAENNTAISSDDPEAIAKLTDKLNDTKESHVYMKALNAHYRKHKTCKGYPGMEDSRAEQIDQRIEKDYSWCKAPFPGYSLALNNAEIHRLEDRIKTLEKRQDTGFVGWEFDGGEVVANTEENRLQILFDEKPSEEMRSVLKSNAFKWSPRNVAWQRQLNDNAIYAAGRVDFIKPLCGKTPRELQPKAAPKKQKDEPQR